MTAGLERKVRQLDNDVHAIYEILGRVESSQHAMRGTQLRHGNRLDEIDARLETQERKIDEIDDRLQSLDGKVQLLDDKVAQIGDRLQSQEQKLDQIIGLLKK